MSEETIVQLAIVAFGILWIGCGVYEHLRTPPYMREAVGTVVMGLFIALSVAFVAAFAVMFISALVGVFQ